MLKAYQQERVPATPLVGAYVDVRTVLAGKGSLRRFPPCPRRAVPTQRLSRRVALVEHFTSKCPEPDVHN